MPDLFDMEFEDRISGYNSNPLDEECADIDFDPFEDDKTGEEMDGEDIQEFDGPEYDF